MEPTRSKIRILPESVTNKIAAGEVVERPASVVKELIENCLDAGATTITIRLTASGLKLIEVIDNGCGMSEQDALLSVERHATSKIQNERDLESIQTFGFRGEALSSISSVSQFTLITKRADDPIGTQIVINGGIIQSVSSVGCPTGTKISVSRIFFNTPVRLKFLKGLTTELSHCIEVIQRYALAHIGVGFKLFHNNKLIFEIPPEMDMGNRLTTLWGKTTFIEMVELPKETIEIELNSFEKFSISTYGYVGLPSLTRSNRSHQLYFINKRPVYNRAIQYAVEEAYRSLLVVGRYPVVVLFVDIPPAYVDVNIHPTKREVKLREEKLISKCITDIIRNRLSSLSKDDISSLRLQGELTKNKTERIYANHKVIQVPENTPDTETAKKIQPEEIHNIELIKPSGIDSLYNMTKVSKLPELTSLEVEKENGNTSPCEKLSSIVPNPLFTDYTPPEEIPMQIFDSYLVVSEEDRLIIIDQHALHERLNFEQLKKELQEKHKTTQRLVIPLVIEVPPHYSKLIESNLDVLGQIGIEIEPFGENTFQILGICPMYDEGKIKDVVFEISEELSQGDLFDRENYFEELLRIATKACKKSIKAGDKLEPIERIALVQGFKSLKPPYTCPHGRPIIIELTLQQMEKSFRRKL